MPDDQPCQTRIDQLERELDEMTVALSQAWDQLVPFLQETPAQADTSQDIEPTLQALMAAADTEMAGVYLFASRAWYAMPTHIQLDASALKGLENLDQERVFTLLTPEGETMAWALAPVMSENQRIGVLGVGTQDRQRTFTAVDLRIVKRMGERIGQQIAAAQLARFREQEAMRARELQIARDIQESNLPRTAPKSSRMQVAFYWQPAREVGGDAWGWVRQSETRIAWFILDVAGKGLPAALAASALHTALSMALRLHLSPAETLRVVNEHLYDAYTQTDLMATAAIASLNATNGALEIANAGHPPLLVRHNRSWLRLKASAPPIGVLPDLRAEPDVLMLHPDDLILAYSDGFSEIQTDAQLWGATGLLKAIPEGARNVNALTRHIVATSQRVGQRNDDQTLVTVRYAGR